MVRGVFAGLCVGSALRCTVRAVPADASAPPTWATPREALLVVAHHAWRTIRIALLVGTILFVINQLDVVLRGEATLATWIKGAVTYLVPFIVSNIGVLVGSRRR